MMMSWGALGGHLRPSLLFGSSGGERMIDMQSDDEHLTGPTRRRILQILIGLQYEVIFVAFIITGYVFLECAKKKRRMASHPPAEANNFAERRFAVVVPRLKRTLESNNDGAASSRSSTPQTTPVATP